MAAGFPDRLQALIEDQKTNGTNLGVSMGMSPQNVYGWLRGGQPKIDSLMRLAVATRVNLNWLLLGEGPMYRR